MDELENRISQVLNNPESMEQIFSIAKSLGLQPPVQTQNTETSVTPDASAAASMGKLLSGLGQSDPRQAALLSALRPYLRPERQKSLDRALRAARLAQAARVAFQNPGSQKSS